MSIRLRLANEQLQRQINQIEPLLDRYRSEIAILEEAIAAARGSSSGSKSSLSFGLRLLLFVSGTRTHEVAIERIDVSRLLEEMRLLRHNLELSISKQNELQNRLDENLRQSRTPREFTFSGRGVSYPDLRVLDGSGALGIDNVSIITTGNEARIRPLGLSATELDRDDYRLLSGEVAERTSMRTDRLSRYYHFTDGLFSSH